MELIEVITSKYAFVYTNLSCNILLATLKQQFCFAKINNCKKCEMNYNNI